MDNYNEEYFQKIEKYESRKDKLNHFIKIIKEYKPKSVLDVGCGNGYLVSELLKEGIYAIGMDFSTYAGKKIPHNFVSADALQKFPFEDKSFDVVFSSDFFEHIPEEKIDDVLAEMRRVGRNIVAFICYKPEPPFHLTVRRYDWWKKKLPDVNIINKSYGGLH